MVYYLNEDDDMELAEEEFTDFDDLLSQWKSYLMENLNSFKVVPPSMYGSGCVCDLKKIFTEGNFSRDYLLSLIPRVNDCYTSCITTEYSKYMTQFLSSFVNLAGSPMSVSDLGEEEIFFYQAFIDIAKERAILNTWDYFTKRKT